MFAMKKVVAFGERDGVQGPAIAKCLTAAGADVVFTVTECVVWTAAGAMDLENQARIKQLAEQYGNKSLIVVIGAGDPDSSELVAETVTTGDPSYAGPLTEVQLGLPVYHILEPEVKEHIPPEVYEEQVALMELALDAEGIAKATKKIRDNASVGS